MKINRSDSRPFAETNLFLTVGPDLEGVAKVSPGQSTPVHRSLSEHFWDQ